MPIVSLGQTDSTVKVPVSELRFFVAEHYKKLSLQEDTLLLNAKCIEYEKQVALYKQEIKNQNDIKADKDKQIGLLDTALTDTEKKLTKQHKINNRLKKFFFTGLVAVFVGGGVLGWELHK